jgi:hypothetical protein
VTFRCQACQLQWTITLASLHRAASNWAFAMHEADCEPESVQPYDAVAQSTKFAADRAATGKSSITRQATLARNLFKSARSAVFALGLHHAEHSDSTGGADEITTEFEAHSKKQNPGEETIAIASNSLDASSAILLQPPRALARA